MLIIKTRDLFTPSGKRTAAKGSVSFIRDWHPQFIGRSYTPRINHVAPDQVWLQTKCRAFGYKTYPQEAHPAGSDVAVPTDHGTREAQA